MDISCSVKKISYLNDILIRILGFILENNHSIIHNNHKAIIKQRNQIQLIIVLIKQLQAILFLKLLLF